MLFLTLTTPRILYTTGTATNRAALILITLKWYILLSTDTGNNQVLLAITVLDWRFLRVSLTRHYSSVTSTDNFRILFLCAIGTGFSLVAMVLTMLNCYTLLPAAQAPVRQRSHMSLK